MNLMKVRGASKDSKHVKKCFEYKQNSFMIEIKNRYNEKARQRCI